MHLCCFLIRPKVAAAAAADVAVVVVVVVVIAVAAAPIPVLLYWCPAFAPQNGGEAVRFNDDYIIQVGRSWV